MATKPALGRTLSAEDVQEVATEDLVEGDSILGDHITLQQEAVETMMLMSTIVHRNLATVNNNQHLEDEGVEDAEAAADSPHTSPIRSLLELPVLVT